MADKVTDSRSGLPIARVCDEAAVDKKPSLPDLQPEREPREVARKADRPGPLCRPGQLVAMRSEYLLLPNPVGATAEHQVLPEKYSESVVATRGRTV